MTLDEKKYKIVGRYCDEMAIPSWACTVLIDSSQIIRCEEYKEKD